MVDYTGVLNALKDGILTTLEGIETNISDERDTAFIDGVTITGGGTIERQLNAIGGTAVNGQFLSTGTMTLRVQWLDAENGSVIREQNVINNAIADDWKTFQLEPTSPYINLILEDESGTDQTVNASYHYR